MEASEDETTKALKAVYYDEDTGVARILVVTSNICFQTKNHDEANNHPGLDFNLGSYYPEPEYYSKFRTLLIPTKV